MESILVSKYGMLSHDLTATIFIGYSQHINKSADTVPPTFSKTEEH